MTRRPRPPGRVTPEEKPGAILAAALKLFAEGGFHATNVPAIADRAGVSVGTLYHYFESKEAIANELYRRTKKDMARSIYDGLPTDSPPEELMRVLWHRSVRYAMAHPLAFRFLELHHHAPYLDEESRALDSQVAAMEHEALELGRRSGTFRPLHDELLSAFVGGALKHLVSAAQAGRISLTTDVIDQAAECSWGAIKKGRDSMDKISLTGENGQVSLSYEYMTCGPDGCDCRGTVAIKSWGLRAEGKVWFLSRDAARFYNQLEACYQSLSGSAEFQTHGGAFAIQVEFLKNGAVNIRGRYEERMGEGNELKFCIQADQSFIGSILEELARVALTYGGATEAE